MSFYDLGEKYFQSQLQFSLQKVNSKSDVLRQMTQLLQVTQHLLSDLLQPFKKKRNKKTWNQKQDKFWAEILSNNKKILTSFYKHHQETVLRS